MDETAGRSAHARTVEAIERWGKPSKAEQRAVRHGPGCAATLWRRPARQNHAPLRVPRSQKVDKLFTNVVLCLKFSSQTQKYSVWEPLRLEFERGGPRGGVEEELHQKVVRVRAGSQHAQSERGQRRPAEVFNIKDIRYG